MKLHPMGVGWLLAALILGAAGAASAQETEAAPTAEEARAREHFEIGRRHYDMGSFREAAREFEAAYELSQRPALLLNVYLSYRDAAAPLEAARALRAYLESGVVGEADRPNLERRLEALERQAAGSASPRPASSPDVVPPALVLGSGGALVLAGIATGIATVAEHGALEEACPAMRCPEAEAGRIDTVRALGITTDVLIGVGAAAAAAGLIWLIVELSAGSPDEPSATLGCGAGGCELRGRF